MNDNICQCPKCMTSFRVTDEQLQVAAGKVRCGYCMSIFLGTDYLINSAVENTVAEEETAHTGNVFIDDTGIIDTNVYREPLEGEGEGEGEGELEREDVGGEEAVDDALQNEEGDLETAEPSDAWLQEDSPCLVDTSFSDDLDDDDFEQLLDETDVAVQAAGIDNSVDSSSENTLLVEGMVTEPMADNSEVANSESAFEEPGSTVLDETTDSFQEEIQEDSYSSQFLDLDAGAESSVDVEVHVEEIVLESPVVIDSGSYDDLLVEVSDSRLVIGSHTDVDSEVDSGVDITVEPEPEAVDDDFPLPLGESKELKIESDLPEFFSESKVSDEGSLSKTTSAEERADEPSPALNYLQPDPPSHLLIPPSDKKLNTVVNESADEPNDVLSLGGLNDVSGSVLGAEFNIESAAPVSGIAVAVSTRTGKGLLWGLGAFGLLIALLSQYGYFNWDKLSANKSMRPVLQATCNIIACDVPVYRNLRKISSDQLSVRSHPEVDNALIVDVIITNNAELAQPFPVLQLTFYDIRSQPVASRTFFPGEFLGGDFRGLTSMPSFNPVRLALEIMDPGADAINYELSLLPSL